MTRRKPPRLIDQIEYHLDEARGQWEYPLTSFEKRRDGRMIALDVDDQVGARSLTVPNALTSVEHARAQRARAAACATAETSEWDTFAQGLAEFARTVGTVVAAMLGSWAIVEESGPAFAVALAIAVAGTLLIVTRSDHRYRAVVAQVWAERLRRYDERIEALGGTASPHPAPLLVDQRGRFLRRRRPRA